MLGNWLIAFALSQVGSHRQAATIVSFHITGWVLVSYLELHEEFPQVIAGLWNVGRGLPNSFFSCKHRWLSKVHCAGRRRWGACGSRSMLARSRLTMQAEEKRRRQVARKFPECDWKIPVGLETMAGYIKKGQSGFQSRAQQAPRAWTGACPGSLKNVASSRAERCGGCSGLQVPNQEPWTPFKAAAACPGPGNPERPLPTNAKIGAFKHVVRCPRSLPLLRYRFRKTSPTAPTKPRIQARQAKTRPSHTNRSKELDPPTCAPQTFHSSEPASLCAILFAPCSLQTPPKIPLANRSKSPGCETRNARQARNGWPWRGRTLLPSSSILQIPALKASPTSDLTSLTVFWGSSLGDISLTVIPHISTRASQRPTPKRKSRKNDQFSRVIEANPR